MNRRALLIVFGGNYDTCFADFIVGGKTRSIRIDLRIYTTRRGVVERLIPPALVRELLDTVKAGLWAPVELSDALYALSRPGTAYGARSDAQPASEEPPGPLRAEPSLPTRWR